MLKVQLLGKFNVGRDGQAIELSSRPLQSLLAYLLLNAGTTVRREQLAGLLWPDSAENNARQNLRQTLWQLGKTIGKEYLVTDRISVGFNVAADYRLDVDHFLKQTSAGVSTDQQVRGMSLYTGALLPGFYYDWAIREREQLQVIYENRMRLLLERLVSEERWRATLEWAEQWIAQGQAPEAAFRAVMRAHAGLGDQAGVIAAYQRCVEILENEFSVAPSAETQALLEQLTADQTPPAARSDPGPSVPTPRLPLQSTPFIGREEELQRLGALLDDPANKLVNILGPGGMGKTRLAVEAARARGDAFSDGVVFVSLAGLDGGRLLASAVADAIGFSPVTGALQTSPGKGKMAGHLINFLQDKQMLLVLDNIEQLSGGLPLLADLLQASAGVSLLTTSRERLNLQAEQVFMIGGMLVPEQTSLDVRTAVEDYDALKLFLASARRSRPDFELTAKNLGHVITICRLVDGLPLGIELAAAWTAVLSPSEIAAEIRRGLDFLASTLHDLPKRQRSIRTVFASTWDQLTANEKSVFAQLSVFRGGFTRQAAERVAGVTPQHLLALANKSLIRANEAGRSQIHELLRQFGQEKLRAADAERETRNRHLAYYLQVAETAEPHLKRDTHPGPWLDRLADDHNNLQAALEWSREADDQVEAGLRLAASLDYFWIVRGYYEEGRQALASLLARPQAQQWPALRAFGLHQSAFFAWMQSDFAGAKQLAIDSMALWRQLGADGRRSLAQALITSGLASFDSGDYNEAAALMQEGLSIMRELDDDRGVARSLTHLGTLALRTGQYEQATLNLEEALPLFRRSGNSALTSFTVSGLAAAAARLGDYDRAIFLEEESLAIRRSANNTRGIAISLGNLAWIAIRRNELKRAADFLLESMSLRRQVLDKVGIAWCLERLAVISVMDGQRDGTNRQTACQRAVRLLGAAEALRSAAGSSVDPMDQAEYEQVTAALQTDLTQALREQAWAQGQAMSLDDMIEYAGGRR